MASNKSGKQATKGAKQIVEENESVLKFYRYMAVLSNAISLIILYMLNSNIKISLYVFSSAIYIASYQFMVFIAKPKYGENGQLLDSGIDLNMEGGLAEHVKDIIILTSICQILSSVLNNYFWLIWLLAPIRFLWILWINFVSPYIFQNVSEKPEVNEKKQKKLERKMKRMQR